MLSFLGYILFAHHPRSRLDQGVGDWVYEWVGRLVSGLVSEQVGNCRENGRMGEWVGRFGESVIEWLSELVSELVIGEWMIVWVGELMGIWWVS